MISFHINSLFSSISYRVGNILIDVGDKWEGFENVDVLLLTHAHFDHIYGLNSIIELNPQVKVYTNLAGKEALLSDKLNMSRYHETRFVCQYVDNIETVYDEYVVDAGCGLTAKAHFTPGHHPSCITWEIANSIFTGDSLIPGIKTITNLPGGDRNLARESETLIRKITKGKIIFPGHKI